MRKIFIYLFLLVYFGNAIAQISTLDRQLQNINQSTVTSGIIYDRSTPLADLCVYNMPADEPHNTADFRFFKQALFELHKASNYGKLVSLEQIVKELVEKSMTSNNFYIISNLSMKFYINFNKTLTP